MTTSMEDPITISQQLRQALETKYLATDPINQLQLLKTQQELLQSIKQLIDKHKYINAQILSFNGITNSNNILDQSLNTYADHSSFQLSGFDDDFNNKSKLREEIETSTIGGVLRDVQEHCSEETYEIVRQNILNNRLKDNLNFQKMTTKLIAERDQLATQIAVLKAEKSNNDKELERYKKIVAGIEDEKRNIRKKIDYILKKEHQVFKLQTSFTFKQKISLELKKRYERLVGSYITNEAKIEKMYDELYKIWTFISNKVESVECQGNCWRKDAMRKAKQQLMEERRIIRQQSTHLQREYQVMNIVSEQFKRIFQEPEKINPDEKSAVKNEESQQSSKSFIKYQ